MTITVAPQAALESRTVAPRAIRISVSHPHGNPNSYQTALAFAEKGWLGCFETGMLSPGWNVARHLGPDWERRVRSREYAGIPNAKKNAHRTFEAVSRLGERIRPLGLTSRVNWYDVLFWGHDLQLSVSRFDVDAIYAYEDGARRTFTAARKKHVTTLYELAAGYYRGAEREMTRACRDSPGLQRVTYSEPRWKQMRKDAELELADVIVVASDWARESLSLSETASNKPVVLIPYGTPVEEIRPRSQPPSGPFTVLFAGQVGLRKGVPHLIDAWEKLRLSDARLILAGSMNLPREYVNEHAGRFEYPGALPRTELLDLMATVDLFVFPSLAEGFGLVIGEAMASGVPVLTTKNTGGPRLITDDVEGWCVSAHEVEPLIERLEWAHKNRDQLFQMGQRARQRAEQWTWTDYRRKLIAELSPYLAGSAVS